MALTTPEGNEELAAQLGDPYPPSSACPSLFTSTSTGTTGGGVATAKPCTPVAIGEDGFIMSWAGVATAGGAVATETTPVASATVGAG